MHQNVQHLPSRLDLLRINLEEIEPQILALSEHKMSEAETEMLNLPNYSLSSTFSRINNIGGGVMILVHNNIISKCKPVNIPAIQSITAEKEFECCISEFSQNNLTFVLACLYRTPQHCYLDPFLEKLEILLEILCKKYKNVVLAGDININVLERNNVYDEFVSVLKMFNMSYKVDFATRITATSETAIDNFITNINDDRLRISGIITQISDHDAQLLEILNVNGTFQKQIRKLSRKFDECYLEVFYKELERLNWMKVFQSSVGEKYDAFMSFFIHYFNVYFPELFRNEKEFSSKIGSSAEVINIKRELLELENFFRQSKAEDIKIQIEAKRKALKLVMEKDKQNYFDKKIHDAKNKNRATWRIVNAEVGKQKKNNDPNMSVISDGIHTTDPIRVSNICNDFFATAVDNFVIPNIPDNINRHVNIPNIQNRQSSLKFKFKTISESELEEIVMAFENKLSAGPDDIPITVIKRVLPTIIKPLTHIINSSLISGQFPKKLKIAKVIPIFKKGNMKDPACYRPVALLSVFSKIYERVVYIQLIHYLETNNLLDNEQHGFRSKKSTITAGVDFINTIIDAIDRREKVIGTFLDLSRAFDSVLHDALLKKLEAIGVHGKELNWFTSYLKGRQQYVEIVHLEESQKHIFKNIYRSDLRSLKYGVPQGSILGPLLFLCYITGMPGIVNDQASVCLYADDANIIFSGKSVEDVEITSAIGLSSINDYLNSYNLILNASKSVVIPFTTKQRRNQLACPSVAINGEILVTENSTRFLGLLVDCNLSWDSHVCHIMKKISPGLYALRQMSGVCSIQTLKSIYHAVIHSHLAYGLCIYGSTSKKNLDKILKQQKRAIRIMLKLGRSESVRIAFSQLRILTIYGQYIYDVIMFFKKQSNVLRNQTHNYNTRYGRITERHRLDLFEKKTIYRGRIFFTKLPNDLQRLESIEKFGKKLKEYLVALSLYSLQEIDANNY
jgi:exonuclease III